MAGYELLYLVSSTKNQEEIEQIKKEVENVLISQDAEIVHHNAWSQRKLTYPVKRIENAFYILCYFTAKTDSLAKIKKELQLSKNIVRSVIVQHKDAKIAHQTFKKRLEAKDQKRTADLRGEEKGRKQPKTAPPIAKPASIVRKPEPVKPKEVPAKSKEKERTAPEKKATLEDLDKKLEDILGEDIEL